MGLVTGAGGPTAVVSVQPGMQVQPVILVDSSGNYVTAGGSAYAPWVPADNGWVLGATDPATLGAAFNPTAGVIYLVRLAVRSAVTVSFLDWAVQTAGSGASTTSFTGLYSPAGTLLAGSSDVGSVYAAVSGSGLAKCPLTTPQALNPATTAWVWAALVLNLGSSQGAMYRLGGAVNPIVNYGEATGPAYRTATYLTGQTSLPASLTMGSVASAGTVPAVWAE